VVDDYELLLALSLLIYQQHILEHAVINRPLGVGARCRALNDAIQDGVAVASEVSADGFDGAPHLLW